MGKLLRSLDIVEGYLANAERFWTSSSLLISSSERGSLIRTTIILVLIDLKRWKSDVVSMYDSIL